MYIHGGDVKYPFAVGKVVLLQIFKYAIWQTSFLNFSIVLLRLLVGCGLMGKTVNPNPNNNVVPVGVGLNLQ
jgi:hypothetical protein